jgi:hypothetical protein
MKRTLKVISVAVAGMRKFAHKLFLLDLKGQIDVIDGFHYPNPMKPKKVFFKQALGYFFRSLSRF